MRARSVSALLGTAATTMAVLLCGGGTAVAKPFHILFPHQFAQPPTTAECESTIGIACYGPPQFQQAYGMKQLYRFGLTGRGRTIVIVDSFGSPTIRADLQTFDQAYGLPAPPSFRIIQPAGPVPPYDPTDANMDAGWGVETSLDVEYSHAIAPGANILLVETPVAETEGTVGFPEIVEAENYVINHNLGDVITQSFGATEQTFPSAQSIFKLRGAYLNALAHGVTVLGASGDGGATDATSDGTDYYPFRVNSWPSSDPLVTSVGGTQLHLDANGFRTAPDNVWNDQALFQSPASGGGGVSTVFSRPFYQDGVAGIVGQSRGTPDVSMSAAVDGGANVYWSFPATDQANGWQVIGGTSEASPLFSGLVAIADQAAGHRLGLLNPRLYAIGDRAGSGLVDITQGNNSVSGVNVTQFPGPFTVTGFDADQGYDLASGLGTANGPRLVGQLAGFGRY
jgi:subtilase family serine protease